MTDILEELDRWIAEWKGVGDFRHPRLPHLERARDEIAVLRQEIEDFAASMPARMNEFSIEVLEKAARECEEREKFLVMQGWHQPDHNTIVTCAAAIRALKDKTA